MKKLAICILFNLCLCLSACGKNDPLSNVEINKDFSAPENNAILEDTFNTDSQDKDASEPELVYFESDEVVNEFFSNYNSFAEITIDAEEIEKGNIRTKALVYIDDFSLEVVNAEDFLSVSMSSAVENESTKLYSIFRDVVKSVNEHITDEEIQIAWNEIHESGYLVEDYDFNSILLTYIPSKELSYGRNNLRIDMTIPLK